MLAMAGRSAKSSRLVKTKRIFVKFVYMINILKNITRVNTRNRNLWTFDHLKVMSLAFFSLTIACTSSEKNNLKPNKPLGYGPLTTTQENLPDPLEEKLNSLSLEQKVGQLFIFGIKGSKLNREVASKITKLNAGSIIIFKRNIKSIKQIHALNSTMQEAAITANNIPLFIMVDQEGGVVSRIKTKPTAPSALSMSQTNDLKLVRDVGRVTGLSLKALGFNFNLAPVVDLSNPNKKNFTGNRSFGDNPTDVFNKAFAFAEGLEEEGVLPTFKHYPGHGGVVADSHYSLPIKNSTINILNKSDAMPFKMLAKSGLSSAVMTAHISFPSIEPTGIPATYSKRLLTNLLRNKYKYQGLIMTDDLEMSGAFLNMDIGERTLAALNAGADLVMIAWTFAEQKRAYDYLVRAVRTGKITEERINASVRRILALKESYAKPPPPLRSNMIVSKLQKIVSISKKVTKVNFYNSLENSKTDFSFLKNKSSAVVFSSTYNFYRSFKEGFALPSSFVVLKKGRRIPFRSHLKSNKKFGVYYVSGMGTAKILNSLPGSLKRRLYVVNSTYPGAIKNREEFLGLVDLNQNYDHSSLWLAKKFTSHLRSLASVDINKKRAQKLRPFKKKISKK